MKLIFLLYNACNFKTTKLFDCRKAVNEMKEMKLLLDMYKGVGKEQRDKVQLMAAERKTRAELEDLRQQVKKIQVRYIIYIVIGKDCSP